MKLHKTYNLATIILMTVVVLSLPATAWSALQIYKVKGNVTIKKGKQTVKATRRELVAENDILTIPKEGRAEILDTDSRRIYSSKGNGTMSVRTLMEQAEAHASDITRNINRKVIAAVADNAASNRNAYEAMGMAIHETDLVVGPPVMLPEGMTYLSYLIADASDPDSLHQCYIALKLSTTDSLYNDGPFCFKVNNSTENPLYFNVMEKGVGKGLRLLIPQNPIAAPKEETVVSAYPFLPDPATTGYIAIASDKDFSVDDVWNLLDPGYDALDDYYLTVLTVE